MYLLAYINHPSAARHVCGVLAPWRCIDALTCEDGQHRHRPHQNRPPPRLFNHLVRLPAITSANAHKRYNNTTDSSAANGKPEAV